MLISRSSSPVVWLVVVDCDVPPVRPPLTPPEAAEPSAWVRPPPRSAPTPPEADRPDVKLVSRMVRLMSPEFSWVTAKNARSIASPRTTTVSPCGSTLPCRIASTGPSAGGTIVNGSGYSPFIHSLWATMLSGPSIACRSR
jgi:hypothetical protein